MAGLLIRDVNNEPLFARQYVIFVRPAEFLADLI